METDTSEAKAKVMNYIESTFHEIFHSIGGQSDKSPSIHLKRIKAFAPHEDQASGEVKWRADEYHVTYTFPGKTKSEAFRFACVLKILNEIHAALSSDVVVTKRDIFYHDPELFSKQEVVDRFIDDIAHTCGVQRSDLNVVGSPKGLVVGLDMSSNEVELIPTSFQHLHLEHLQWVLVVEKEASFKALTEHWSHLTNHLGRGLLITAKGYPDLATREFLGSLQQHNSFLSVFGLFDFDPYGIDILKCYRYGSKASASAPTTAIPGMRWTGIKSKDLIHGKTDGIRGVLDENDRNRAQNMLSTFRVGTTSFRPVPGLEDCAEELRRMLMLNQKAEIQLVDDQRLLADWVVGELMQALS